MATASPLDAALRDTLEGLSAATRDLDTAGEPAEVAQLSAELALRLTRSASAVVALGRPNRGFESFYTAAADPSRAPLARTAAEIVAEARLGRAGGPAGRGVMGAELHMHGHVLGALAVSRPGGYTEIERAALEVFAAQVSLALRVAAGWDDLAISIERGESAHELAVEVLHSVSSHAVQGHNLDDFYGRLARTVGELVGADTVVFWRLGEEGVLAPVSGGHRIDQAVVSRLKPTKCLRGSDDLAKIGRAHV